MYKRPKKQAVQLTSLLDLLFVMIFVSLIQQKQIIVVPDKKPKVAKPKASPKPTPKVVEKPKPKAKAAPTPAKVIPRNFGLRATFHFYPLPQNPRVAEGKYLMQGVFDTKTGQLQLGGIRWLKRPTNYDMVPLGGVINSGNKTFTGRIEFQGCQQFSLNRKTTLTGTPISGQWEGVYQCTQGPTGLTLTIE
jgi:hypothetical protein